MAIMLMAVALGAVAGLATGGRIGNLGRLPFGWWPLLLGAAALELTLGDLPSASRWPLAAADCAVVVAWCLHNRGPRRSVTGPDLIAGGTTLNAVVMAANGGMPVSLTALREAGFPATTDVARGHFYKHVVMTTGTHLRDLGDFIPLRVLHTVLSPGDLVMLVGFALTVFSAVRWQSARRRVLPRRSAVDAAVRS